MLIYHKAYIHKAAAFWYISHFVYMKPNPNLNEPYPYPMPNP